MILVFLSSFLIIKLTGKLQYVWNSFVSPFFKADIDIEQVSELKMVNFNYFQFLSHFYWDLGLGFSVTSHVTITQPHIMMESSRIFWRK